MLEIQKKMERAIINHDQPEDDWVSYTVKVKYETGILEEVHMMFCQNTVFNFVIFCVWKVQATLLINISPLFDHILDHYLMKLHTYGLLTQLEIFIVFNLTFTELCFSQILAKNINFCFRGHFLTKPSLKI